MSREYGKETICIHSGWKPKNGEPRVLPIYQSTTFKYETSEQMGRLFDLEESGFFYTRLQILPMNVWPGKYANWRAVWLQCSPLRARRPIIMRCLISVRPGGTW